MPYLIDGHNLIPKLGLRLDSFDDEIELVERLNEYCRLSRKAGLEVYFDNGSPGQAETRRIGLLTAHFIRKPRIADEAIRQRLKALGRAAKNWTVVSSDHRVQQEAGRAGAKSISSEEFAATIMETLRSGPPAPEPKTVMSEHELEEWMQFFRKDRGDLSKF